jgi:hypothetical protein
VAVLAIAAMSIDLAIEPHYHETPDVPAFFTDGTYEQYIGPDDVVLGIPADLGGDMMWQERTDLHFRLGRAYIGPIHPIGYLNASVGIITTEPWLRLPGENALRHFIRERRVSAVVATHPVPVRVLELMDDVLGTRPIEVDGVHLWLVPPKGPTPIEPATPLFDPTPNGVGEAPPNWPPGTPDNAT